MAAAVLWPAFALFLRMDRKPRLAGACAGAAVGALLSLASLWSHEGAAAAWLAFGAASGAVTGALLATAFVFQVDRAAARVKAPSRWFWRARADRRPSYAWYWARAVYVSRRDYRHIFLAFLTLGVPLGAAGLIGPRIFFHVALAVAVIGLALLAYSLLGLYRMYARPSLRYYRKLLGQGGVRDGAVVADLHIGTYRTAFALAELLPNARICSIDCWDVQGPPAEAAVADVRALEPPPTGEPRIFPAKARGLCLPLEDASCDAVVLGFGTHEIPTGGPRERLFAEAKRVLKPGGAALLFEHGYDLHNYFIFGPVIDHVTRRDDWLATMKAYFDDVTVARSSAAVDLLAGRRHA